MLFKSKKSKRIVSGVIIGILIFAMVAGVAVSFV